MYVGGVVAVHAYQLHSWEARRNAPVEPDTPALENLEFAGGHTGSAGIVVETHGFRGISRYLSAGKLTHVIFGCNLSLVAKSVCIAETLTPHTHTHTQ